MRFRLTLSCRPPQSLPLNYQYPLSAWIYKTFNEGDAEFAQWLHQKGYTNDKHQYKLFTFSWLDIPKVKLDKERQCLHIQSTDVYFTFSLPMEEAAETFIKGVFQNQQCHLGDREFKAEFSVSSVEKMAEPDLGNETTFRCLSPICLSEAREKNGKLIPKYLDPQDENFEEKLFNNLIYRYQTAIQYEPAMEGHQWEPQERNTSEFDLSILNKPKSKLVTVKAGTPHETKIRGYQFDFSLKAPEPLLKFGYEAGFGEKGSLGFGCVEVQ